MTQDNRAAVRNPLPNPLAGERPSDHLARNYQRIGIAAVAGAASASKLSARQEPTQRVLPAFLREEGI